MAVPYVLKRVFPIFRPKAEAVRHQQLVERITELVAEEYLDRENLSPDEIQETENFLNKLADTTNSKQVAALFLALPGYIDDEQADTSLFSRASSPQTPVYKPPLVVDLAISRRNSVLSDYESMDSPISPFENRRSFSDYSYRSMETDSNEGRNSKRDSLSSCGSIGIEAQFDEAYGSRGGSTCMDDSIETLSMTDSIEAESDFRPSGLKMFLLERLGRKNQSIHVVGPETAYVAMVQRITNVKLPATVIQPDNLNEVVMNAALSSHYKQGLDRVAHELNEKGWLTQSVLAFLLVHADEPHVLRAIKNHVKKNEGDVSLDFLLNPTQKWRAPIPHKDDGYLVDCRKQQNIVPPTLPRSVFSLVN